MTTDNKFVQLCIIKQAERMRMFDELFDHQKNKRDRYECDAMYPFINAKFIIL